MQFQRNDEKIFGSSLQKFSAQKNTFQWTDASNCVYFSPQNLFFYADKSILRAVIWIVRLMHALYSNHIGYNETPTLPVLNGPPSWVVRSASKKRPIRSSIQTVLFELPKHMLNIMKYWKYWQVYAEQSCLSKPVRCHVSILKSDALHCAQAKTAKNLTYCICPIMYFFHVKSNFFLFHHSEHVFWETVLLSTHNICYFWEKKCNSYLGTWPRGHTTFFSCSSKLSTKFQLLIKAQIRTNEEVSWFKSLRPTIHADKC